MIGHAVSEGHPVAYHDIAFTILSTTQSICRLQGQMEMFLERNDSMFLVM